jgi:hypothetical protein
MHHIAGASLPVCIGLLILTATARAGLWSEISDADLTRISRQYLEPLSTWCVVAAVVNAAAVVLAGDMDLLWLAPPVGAGCAALLLLSSAEESTEPKAAAKAEPAKEPEPATEPEGASPPPPPVGAGSGLWAKVDESPQQRDGLWSSR